MKVELELTLKQLNLIKKLVSEKLSEDERCIEILRRRKLDFECEINSSDEFLDELEGELDIILDDIDGLQGDIFMEEGILITLG